MIGPPCKIAIAGTHSTGKTTFMRKLEEALLTRGFRPKYVHDSAVNARDLGFPILRDHTFESTAWIMAEAMRLETVASLTADVILVDRPIPDALGYLSAALAVTGRSLLPGRIERLEAICDAWIGEYNLVFVTELDRAIPIGPGRDDDDAFRVAAGVAISEILGRISPGFITLSAIGTDQALATAVEFIERHRSQS